MLLLCVFPGQRRKQGTRSLPSCIACLRCLPTVPSGCRAAPPLGGWGRRWPGTAGRGVTASCCCPDASALRLPGSPEEARHSTATQLHRVPPLPVSLSGCRAPQLFLHRFYFRGNAQNANDSSQAIPLFVTSLLVPFLVVILRVVRSDTLPHHRLASKPAASYVFAAMWTPVIMLLLGGFTIAAALSKYNIAKMMATFVLSKAGTKPRTVLLTSMGVAMFASMWISNVAAPVLCFSIVQPILRNLPSDSDMSKALIMGIALASNMGGAASPIASPQNLIALQNMEPQPGWGIWFFVALPVCILSILLIWLLLLITFRPGRNTTIVPIRPMKDRFTGIQWFISLVTLATIVLWCVSHQLEGVFGDMGVIAIIPIVLFFGTGILTKEDFNNFLWTIIILAAGGLALGKAVNSSGLLTTIAVGITDGVDGMGLYAVFCVFCALIAVVATFISHTVAALIILPLVREVGLGMAEPHPNLLVMGAVLMASAAMGLPTSGFPNMTAIMMEDPQTGQRYLQVRHFLTRGVPSSVLAYGVVVTVGYGAMRAVGF